MHLHKIIILALLTTDVSSCGRPQVTKVMQVDAAQEAKAPEFRIYADSSSHSQSPSFVALTDCRAHIKSAMCLVDDRPDDLSKAECLAGGEAYASHFEAIYDRLSPALEQMFCSVNHFYVFKHFDGTALGGVVCDTSRHVTGTIFGVRQALLDQPYSLASWATWKEQLSFGGDPHPVTLRPDLPSIGAASSTAPHSADDFLFFVLIHEIGHMFDFANNLNRFGVDHCPTPATAPPEPAGKAEPGSWSALSWQNMSTVLPEQDFPERQSLCFYQCDGHTIGKELIPAIYRGLERSNFVSLYASTNPFEDFADSLAYLTLAERPGSFYVIDDHQGDAFDAFAHLKGPNLAAKVAYIKEFFAQSSIRYPGQ